MHQASSSSLGSNMTLCNDAPQSYVSHTITLPCDHRQYTSPWRAHGALGIRAQRVGSVIAGAGLVRVDIDIVQTCYRVTCSIQGFTSDCLASNATFTKPQRRL